MVDIEIQGVDDSNEDEETSGVGGETPGVDENENEDDEDEEVETDEDEEVEEEAENNEEDKTTTRASGSMSLWKQSRKGTTARAFKTSHEKNMTSSISLKKPKVMKKS